MGVAGNRASAEQIVGNLRLAGLAQEQVSLIMVTQQAPEALEDVADQTGEGAAEVAGGAAKGAALGGTTGLLAGLATLAIPGIGPVIGAGALLALFGGGGAVVGALSGAFSTENVANQVIERYGMALREGQAVISVTAPDAEAAKRAEEILAHSGASNINSYMEDVSSVTDAPGVTDVSQ
jgi:hypothetical protein